MTDEQNRRDEWLAHMDRCAQQCQGDSLEDVMLRASFEHAKSYTAENIRDEIWVDTCRGEVVAMLTAAMAAGYLIHKAAE